jgi:hypothetical protein
MTEYRRENYNFEIDLENAVVTVTSKKIIDIPSASEMNSKLVHACYKYDPSAPKPAPVPAPRYTPPEKLPKEKKSLDAIKKAFEADLELFYKDVMEYIQFELETNREYAERTGRILRTVSTQGLYNEDEYSEGYNFDNIMLFAYDDKKIHNLYYKTQDGDTFMESIAINPYKAFGFEPVFKRIERELTDKGYIVRILKRSYDGMAYHYQHDNYFLEVEVKT